MGTKITSKAAATNAAPKKAALKKAASKMGPAKSVDDYLAVAPKDKRAALTKLIGS